METQTIELNGVPITIEGNTLWVSSGADAAKLCPSSHPIQYRTPWENERECMCVPAQKTSDHARTYHLCLICDSWVDAEEFDDDPKDEGPPRCADCVDEDGLLWAKMLERLPAGIVHRAMGHLIATSNGLITSAAFETARSILQRAVTDIRVGWIEPRRAA